MVQSSLKSFKMLFEGGVASCSKDFQDLANIFRRKRFITLTSAKGNQCSRGRLNDADSLRHVIVIMGDNVKLRNEKGNLAGNLGPRAEKLAEDQEEKKGTAVKA